MFVTLTDSHLFSRSVSDSWLTGLGQGLHEFTEPPGEPPPPPDRGVPALDVRLWSNGEPGKGGEAQSGLRVPAGGRQGGEPQPDLQAFWRPTRKRTGATFILFFELK